MNGARLSVILRLASVAALLVTVAGAHLWLARVHSVALPFWDQWDAEGAVILKPWREGTLTWRAFLAPHNEHRIVLTRGLAYVLTVLDGRWDAQLEVAVNALLWAAGLAAMSLTLRVAPWKAAAACLVAAAYFSLPYSWEDTLGGFQSQYYFLIILSLAAAWGLLTGEAGRPRWLAGAAAGILALGSMASGFVWAPAVWMGLMARVAHQRRGPTASEWSTAAFSLAAVLVWWATRVDYQTAELRAESVLSFLIALGRCAAWPWIDRPWLAFVFWAPAGWLAWTSLVRRRFQADTLLAAMAWTIAQMAALAWGRGAHGAGPASRYMDVLSLGPMLNALALWRWLDRHGWSRARGVIAAGWAATLALGLAQLTSFNLGVEAPERSHWYHVEETNVRGYLASGDADRWLRGKPDLAIPYPDPQHLKTLLDDPAIRPLLPPIYLPARDAPAAVGSGWLRAGELSRQARGLLRNGRLLCFSGLALGLASLLAALAAAAVASRGAGRGQVGP